jgi:hypothetical protein
MDKEFAAAEVSTDATAELGGEFRRNRLVDFPHQASGIAAP